VGSFAFVLESRLQTDKLVGQDGRVSETQPQFSLDVDTALRQAVARHTLVTIQLRCDGDVSYGTRTIEGVPVGFRAASDGRTRVIIQLIAGESEQLVLLDRISRVTPGRASETTS
jgi:hypothetical protein